MDLGVSFDAAEDSNATWLSDKNCQLPFERPKGMCQGCTILLFDTALPPLHTLHREAVLPGEFLEFLFWCQHQHLEPASWGPSELEKVTRGNPPLFKPTIRGPIPVWGGGEGQSSSFETKGFRVEVRSGGPPVLNLSPLKDMLIMS